MMRYALVTDLDGTLLGDDDALRTFWNYRASLPVSMRLVYASGRLVEDVRRLIERDELCRPDAIIGGVGTQIELFDGAACDWCRPSLESWDRRRVCRTLSHLSLQAEEFQTEHKVSYRIYDAAPKTLDDLRLQLSSAGIDADLIYSSARDLDVVPRGINKGSAAKYLANRWQIDPRRIIACGDSGNDASLFQGDFRGVVVANCLPELRRMEGVNLFFASRTHAGGIMEGTDHWLAQDAVAV